jgi:hypothetical protein
MKSYFKIPLYLEVETKTDDRKKVTVFFNGNILPAILYYFKRSNDELMSADFNDELDMNTKEEKLHEEIGITSMAFLDLDQHLRKIGNNKKT